jgi:serine/threonine protein kinase
MPDAVRTVGRYGILRELGRGGMAVVYLARQEDLDRLVALKELAAFHAADPDFARRFVRESRLAGSLVHPNVITVFDYFEQDRTPYIAMEYVQRGSLRPYVGQMSLAQIGGVLEGVLAGLAAAEALGIVHRDLKPENLMVTAAGGVKIADFGIAKATHAADTGAFQTATGTTVGTPQYMAPEQAMAKEIGAWTDVYAVGCISYELFTGRPPFADVEEPMAIMVRHITEALPPAAEVADVDPEISAWIERLTVKEPSARPASAAEAWNDFEEILIGKLGPRWRRESRLADPPQRVPGPATPPPSEPLGPVEGIDVEGTGPDTGQDLPAAGEDEYETYHTPPSGPPTEWRAEEPPAEPAPPPPTPPPAPVTPLPPTTPAPVTPPPSEPAATTPPPVTPPPWDAPTTPAPVTPPPSEPAEPPPPPAPPSAPYTPPPSEPAPAGLPPEAAAPLPPRAVTLARAGGAALLPSLLIPLLAEFADRWNVWAVLSPFEAVGVALAAWALVRARPPAPLAAGALIGFGVLTAITAVGLVKFTSQRLDALSVLLAVIALLGAAALLAAGLATPRAPDDATAVDPAPLVLGLGGAALAAVALFVNYDGLSTLWSEVPEGFSAEFFFEPAALAVTMLAGVMLLGARPRFARGLLLAAGVCATLHHLGLIVAAWRAVGEVGDVKAAGFIGLLGGLLALAAAQTARPRS